MEHVEKLRSWVDGNKEFLYDRALREVESLVPDNTDTEELANYVYAATELETVGDVLLARAFLAAMTGVDDYNDLLTASALSAWLRTKVVYNVYQVASPRLKRGMKGKMFAKDFAHGVNTCLVVGMGEKSLDMAEIGTRSVASGQMRLGSVSQYAAYSLIAAQRHFKLEETPWPSDAEDIGGYGEVLREWPSVTKSSVLALLQHHELALDEPDTFEPAWEWYLIPYRAFPIEVLALRRMLNLSNEFLHELDHPILNPWIDLDLKAEEGEATKVIREIETRFSYLLEPSAE